MTASRTRTPRSAANSREFPSTISAVKSRSLVIGFTAVVGSGFEGSMLGKMRGMGCLGGDDRQGRAMSTGILVVMSARRCRFRGQEEIRANAYAESIRSRTGQKRRELRATVAAVVHPPYRRSVSRAHRGD